ncbi:MAG: hypothetical protein ABIF82_07640 [Planctomycetota bacterium]
MQGVCAKQEKVFANVSLPGAAIIIGVALLLEALAAPFFAPPRVLWLVRLLLGGFGALFVILGLLVIWDIRQDNLRTRLPEEAED